MKNLKSYLLGAAVAVFAIAGSAQAAVIVDQSNTAGNAVFGAAIFGNFGGQSAGQTFTVGVDGTLDHVDVLVQTKRGSPAADLVLTVRNVTSGQPGATVLATGSVTSAAFVDGYNTFDVSAANLDVNIGDVLSFVLSTTASLANDYLIQGYDPLYSGGGAFLGNTGSWNGHNADYLFQTFVDEQVAAAPEPATLALLGLGLAGLGMIRRRRAA